MRTGDETSTTPAPDRVLGMLGGMAWPSTAEAYTQVNRRVQTARGGDGACELLLWSADFGRVHAMQAQGDWAGAGRLLADAARRLQDAGAGALVLLTNTMHRVAPAVEDAVDIPLLHVADATAAACRAAGAQTVGLLGTRFTMEEEGVRDRLQAHGLHVVTPPGPTRAAVHGHIYDELVRGIVSDGARTVMAAAAAGMVTTGAQAVIAGCTEIELVLADTDVTVPYVATTSTLIDAAVAWLLDGAVPPSPA